MGMLDSIVAVYITCVHENGRNLILFYFIVKYQTTGYAVECSEYILLNIYVMKEQIKSHFIPKREQI